MKTYIGLLRKDPDSDFGVDFPDFPGCITAGETLEEAQAFAAEALQFHINGMLEDGEAIPEPSGIDAIMADPENAGAVAIIVRVPETKAKRINITIPESDLAEVDAYARDHGLSRSAFLLKAARQAIAAGQ